jgi:hypothetical protein
MQTRQNPNHEPESNYKGKEQAKAGNSAPSGQCTWPWGITRGGYHQASINREPLPPTCSQSSIHWLSSTREPTPDDMWTAWVQWLWIEGHYNKNLIFCIKINTKVLRMD